MKTRQHALIFPPA